MPGSSQENACFMSLTLTPIPRILTEEGTKAHREGRSNCSQLVATINLQTASWGSDLTLYNYGSFYPHPWWASWSTAGVSARPSRHPFALASVGARGGVLGSPVTVSQLPWPPAKPIPGRPGAWRGRRRLAAGDLGALAGPPHRGWIWVVGPPALPACPAAGRCGQHSDLALGDRGEPARSGAEPQLRWVSRRTGRWEGSLRAAGTLLCFAGLRMRGSAQVGDQT